MAVLIVLIGSVASVASANGLANSTDAKNHRAFVEDTTQIAATLRLSIQHEQDLIESADSFLIGNPDATQHQFTAWAKSVNVLHRFRDVSGLGVIDYVPYADLAAYARELSLRQSAPFKIVPPGKRPFYCIAPIGIFRKGAQTLPADYDVCDSSARTLITTARNTGKSAVLPYLIDGVETLGLETPIYRGGGVPSTLAGRQGKFVELIALLLVPRTFLATALVGHASTAVALHYGSPTSSLVFRSGSRPTNAQHMKVDLLDGWFLETAGDGGRQGLLGNDGALAILFGGIALSLMVGALIFQLSTSRERSMHLVGERTAQLQFQALHDSLTGLPNRALIIDRIEQLLERNRRNDSLGAALFVDLDDFKNVNDSLGHEAGDQLLVLVAERMKSTLRGADTIGRMGGDEFVILVDGGDPSIAPDLVAQRLLNVLRKPFVLKGSAVPLYVNTSIGIAVGDRRKGSELLRDADVALYQAKGAGKNQYAFFNSKMGNDTERRIALEFDLRSALSGDEFFLLYQPIYNLEDLTIVGVEALLRWEHPTEGPIQPDEFIPILERTGQIREVGAWVVGEATEQMQAWHELGHRLDVSVNVSGRQLDSDALVDHISDALTASGLPSTSLIIEVTETGLMLDVESAIERLQVIKGLGVRIAIDDFGTGYSSLAYLRQFPIDCIKIDRSFTESIATSDESKALVKTFIQLGKDLGLKTLAEGVESIEQMDLLRESRVNEVQGFLFSRPLEPSALEAQLLTPMRRSGLATPPANS